MIALGILARANPLLPGPERDFHLGGIICCTLLIVGRMEEVEGRRGGRGVGRRRRREREGGDGRKKKRVKLFDGLIGINGEFI